MSNGDLVVLVALWVAWCALHSALISLTVTRFLQDRLGNSYRFYRLFYNILAILTIIPLYLFTQTNVGQVVFSWQGGWRVIQIGILSGALLLFVLGALKYDLKTFLGITQIKADTSDAKHANHTIMSTSGTLDASGVLGFSRHPWYLAALMLIWSWQKDIHLARFWVNCVLSGYLIVGTLLEERKLRLELGQSYRDYSEEVSMLLPIKWLRKKVARVRS